ncbi:MAG: hypothetical protein H0X25_06890 [Acidobacteriales bacterium]|nr:hypothetical protein [Terriglobales bacterium]
MVRKLDRDSLQGYVASAQIVRDGRIEVLNTAGTVIGLDLREIKCVYFVREFGDSESLVRKTFTTRPRVEGLWLRLRFKDGDSFEGTMPNELLQTMPEGFLITPPDLQGNTTRVFVPRYALESLTVLGVVGSAHRRRKALEDQRQVRMFGE